MKFSAAALALLALLGNDPRGNGSLFKTPAVVVEGFSLKSMPFVKKTLLKSSPSPEDKSVAVGESTMNNDVLPFVTTPMEPPLAPPSSSSSSEPPTPVEQGYEAAAAAIAEPVAPLAEFVDPPEPASAMIKNIKTPRSATPNPQDTIHHDRFPFPPSTAVGKAGPFLTIQNDGDNDEPKPNTVDYRTAPRQDPFPPPTSHGVPEAPLKANPKDKESSMTPPPPAATTRTQPKKDPFPPPSSHGTPGAFLRTDPEEGTIPAPPKASTRPLPKKDPFPPPSSRGTPDAILKTDPEEAKVPAPPIASTRPVPKQEPFPPPTSRGAPDTFLKTDAEEAKIPAPPIASTRPVPKQEPFPPPTSRGAPDTFVKTKQEEANIPAPPIASTRPVPKQEPFPPPTSHGTPDAFLNGGVTPNGDDVKERAQPKSTLTKGQQSTGDEKKSREEEQTSSLISLVPDQDIPRIPKSSNVYQAPLKAPSAPVKGQEQNHSKEEASKQEEAPTSTLISVIPDQDIPSRKRQPVTSRLYGLKPQRTSVPVQGKEQKPQPASEPVEIKEEKPQPVSAPVESKEQKPQQKVQEQIDPKEESQSVEEQEAPSSSLVSVRPDQEIPLNPNRSANSKAYGMKPTSPEDVMSPPPFMACPFPFSKDY